jgi:large subunit ribosomal protein L6
MSRLSKKSILIPEGAEIEIQTGLVKANGPQGSLCLKLPGRIKIEKVGTELSVKQEGEDKKNKALAGTIRQLVANMLTGVTRGWEKNLEVVGTGYRPALEGEALVLSLGFSHRVRIPPTPGIKIEISENKIRISGVDKALVGQVAAEIRKVRPPDPYKGKGIRYLGEVLKLKPGKAAKGAGGPAALTK